MREYLHTLIRAEEVAAYISKETNVETVLRDVRKWCKTCDYHPNEYIVAIMGLLSIEIAATTKINREAESALVTLFEMILRSAVEARK